MATERASSRVAETQGPPGPHARQAPPTAARGTIGGVDDRPRGATALGRQESHRPTGNGCPSAPAMKHSGVADGPASSTVSQARAGCKQKSGGVGVVDQTAGAGAKRSSSRRDRNRRQTAAPGHWRWEQVIGQEGPALLRPRASSRVSPTSLLCAGFANRRRSRRSSGFRRGLPR